MKRRIAAIDIGTNSVLLSIAEKAGETITPVYEAAVITRIGEGLTKSKCFKPEAMERTISTLKDYVRICGEKKAEEIYVVGTAAMRESENSAEFMKKVKIDCGLDVEIISGDREAELCFKAVERDFGSDAIVVDIGGGSTEFIFPDEGGELKLVSLDLGSVTLHEKYAKSNPISESDFRTMQEEVGAAKIPDAKSQTLIATAGTATTLAAMKLRLKEYSHSEVHGLVLEKDDLQEIIEELKVRSIEERKKLPGLEPKRADVILPGALILLAAMEHCGFNQVTVSDRGVRWGLLYERL